MGRLPLPITDYVTDTKSVLDNSLRILQASPSTAAYALLLQLGTALLRGGS